MTAKTQTPKPKSKTPKPKLSLWQKAQLLTPTVGLSQLLEAHELLLPETRKRNILAAKSKGLIKAKVLL